MGKPGDNNGPSAELKAAIDSSFGSLDKLKTDFGAAGMHFGWIVDCVQKREKDTIHPLNTQLLGDSAAAGHGWVSSLMVLSPLAAHPTKTTHSCPWLIRYTCFQGV